MSRYIFPDFPSHKIIYKGKRFIAMLDEAESESQAEGIRFTIWDGLYDAELSNGIRRSDGTCEGELSFTHVNVKIKSAKSIQEFIKYSQAEQEKFFKESGN